MAVPGRPRQRPNPQPARPPTNLLVMAAQNAEAGPNQTVEAVSVGRTSTGHPPGRSTVSRRGRPRRHDDHGDPGRGGGGGLPVPDAAHGGAGSWSQVSFAVSYCAGTPASNDRPIMVCACCGFVAGTAPTGNPACSQQSVLAGLVGRYLAGEGLGDGVLEVADTWAAPPVGNRWSSSGRSQMTDERD